MEDKILTTKTVIDTVYNVTLEALNKSQEFYNSAFSNFAVVVSVLSLFLIAFTVVAVAFNFKVAGKVEEEFEEFKKDFEKFKEQSENKIRGLVNLIEYSKELQKEENKKFSLKIDTEIQEAINTAFSDEQKRQDFTNNYIREIKRFREDDPDTLVILDKFQKEKGLVEFIKYLEGFLEALSYWNKEKLENWMLLSKKQKEAEFLECIKQVDSGELKELQEKIARFQSIIPKTVFFQKLQNFIKQYVTSVSH